MKQQVKQELYPPREGIRAAAVGLIMFLLAINIKIFYMKELKLVTNSIIGLIFLLTLNACSFAGGSYPYAETYELNYSDEEVKAAIDEFKRKKSEYVVPKVTINNDLTCDLIDEQSKEPNYWYIVYFYYPKENQIILTWTRPTENGKTTFAFVSINDGLTLGNWKEINKDFSDLENEEQKKKFEERILNRISEILGSR